MDLDAAQDAFERARDDAALEEEVVFVPFKSQPRTTPAAAFHPPGEPASLDELRPLDEAGRKTMTDNQGSYRVACWLGLPDPVVRAVLRHEFEHARQWKWGGGLATFQLALAERDMMDFVGYGNLPANGQTYNLVPIELDANGAASRFVRRQEGHEAADEYASSIDPGLFRRRPAPEPLDTLPLRVLCHGAVWPEALDEYLTRHGVAPGPLLDRLFPGARRLWQVLKADAELAKLRGSITAVVPTAQSIQQSESPEAAWTPTKAAILLAVDRARVLTGLSPTPV